MPEGKDMVLTVRVLPTDNFLLFSKQAVNLVNLESLSWYDCVIQMFEALYVSRYCNVIFDIFPVRPSYAVHFHFPSFNLSPMLSTAQIYLSNILHYCKPSANQQYGRNCCFSFFKACGFLRALSWEQKYFFCSAVLFIFTVRMAQTVDTSTLNSVGSWSIWVKIDYLEPWLIYLLSFTGLVVGSW